MKPNAVMGAMARPASSLLALAALAATPAWAGDRALIDFIGYSETGQYFAFTELGIQDGSGFPYANLYVLDVTTDQWVSGAPFRVRLDSEDASLSEARQQVTAAARPTLDTLDIGYPVDIWALSGDGVAGLTDTLEFGIPHYLGPKTVRDPQSIRLQTYPAPAAQSCGDYTEQAIKGFALTHIGQDETLVHRDASVPASRGCPLDYALFAVVAPIQAENLDHAVAIVSVYALGFEGPDRRFLAVPIGH